MSMSNLSNEILSSIIKNKVNLKSSHDAVMIALHLFLLKKNFKCVALSEAEPIAKELIDIPSGWNSNGSEGEGLYTFQYSPPANNNSNTNTNYSSSDQSKNNQSNIILKGIVVDNILSIHVLYKNDDEKQKENKAINLDFTVWDYISKNSELNSYSTLYKDLSGLLSRFDSSFSDNFLPKDNKNSTTNTNNNNNNNNNRLIEDDPLRIGEPRGPYYRPHHMFPPGGGLPSNNGPFGGDIYPGLGPGGMLVGPEQLRGNYIGPTRPGALQPRFDPYGPVPGLGEPDNDHFRPPSNNNGFPSFPFNRPGGGNGFL